MRAAVGGILIRYWEELTTLGQVTQAVRNLKPWQSFALGSLLSFVDCCRCRTGFGCGRLPYIPPVFYREPSD